MEFYLGADAHWLATAGVPLMVSHRRLRRRITLPRATAPWVCDSGGFSELQQYGRWTIGPAEYATALCRYREEIGRLEWAAPQDWMCEPIIINGGTVAGQHFAGTGLTVAEHQRRTIASVLQLRRLVPDVPVIPVLQGWELDDYRAHVEQYAAAGIDLTAEPLVGLGSVCRRQDTAEIGAIAWTLCRLGLRLHGFGVKAEGLRAYGHLLASADSQAGSFGARKRIGHCTHGLVRWEANCPEWARLWRDDVLASMAQPRQLDLFAHLTATVPTGGVR